jgi:oxidase EvaA
MHDLHVTGSKEISEAIAIHPEDVRAVIASRFSDAALHDDAVVAQWIQQARDSASLQTMLVPLEDLRGWSRDARNGNIVHETGRFFSVIGIHCRHRVDRLEIEWDQPIIEQPETGILGILAKQINGILHFCLQAKVEPGNIGTIQLSPTVQATYSNYTAVHGGTTPLFLEHFISPQTEQIIFAKMQSEDGGRFLYKSNRNMIVHAGDDFPDELPDGFIWLTLRQVASLFEQHNLVNACARSILSSLVFAAWPAFAATPPSTSTRMPLPPHGLEGIRATLQWLDDRRSANHMLSRRIGLNELQEWEVDGKGFFSHQEKRFFRIVGLNVSSGSREVRNWSQPIIENPAAGIIGLLLRKGHNGTELLMQAKTEAGNRTAVQLGPTVQFTQGNYEGSRKLLKPFLYDEFLNTGPFQQIHKSHQSEEGARFYREYHVHRILIMPDNFDLPIPSNYRWLPLEHVLFLLHLGEQVNSCARSILSCLL